MHMRNFSGTRGFYSSAKLDSRSSLVLRQIIQEQQLPCDTKTFHVTIMYSPNAVIVPLVVNALEVADPLLAMIAGFGFVGSKGKYFVAFLHSHTLRGRHSFWKRMGATHTFEDYLPHITLHSNCDVMGRLEKTSLIDHLSKQKSVVGRTGLLTFENEIVEDLDEEWTA